jgi:hypothetical protein
MQNSSANNTLFSKERIETLIVGVKQAKDATKASGKERTLLNQYEILTAGNLEKSIKRRTSDGECYVDTVCLGHPDLYFWPVRRWSNFAFRSISQ